MQAERDVGRRGRRVGLDRDLEQRRRDVPVLKAIEPTRRGVGRPAGALLRVLDAFEEAVVKILETVEVTLTGEPRVHHGVRFDRRGHGAERRLEERALSGVAETLGDPRGANELAHRCEAAAARALLGERHHALLGVALAAVDVLERALRRRVFRLQVERVRVRRLGAVVFAELLHDVAELRQHVRGEDRLVGDAELALEGAGHLLEHAQRAVDEPRAPERVGPGGIDVDGLREEVRRLDLAEEGVLEELCAGDQRLHSLLFRLRRAHRLREEVVYSSEASELLELVQTLSPIHMFASRSLGSLPA